MSENGKIQIVHGWAEEGDILTHVEDPGCLGRLGYDENIDKWYFKEFTPDGIPRYWVIYPPEKELEGGIPEGYHLRMDPDGLAFAFSPDAAIEEIDRMKTGFAFRSDIPLYDGHAAVKQVLEDLKKRIKKKAQTSKYEQR